MLRGNTAGIVCAAGCLIVVLTGCGQGQSATPRAPAHAASGSAPKYDVQVANAESKLTPAVPTEMAESDDPAPAETAPSEPAVLPSAKAAVPLSDLDGAAVAMPAVVMSNAHAASCLVAVGDAMPDFEMTDLAGNAQSLHKLLGEKLTVVAFWNGRRPTALEELADMQPAVCDRYGANGVSVVGVNTGDDPQLARELAEQAGARFTNLSDRDGTALRQVGSGPAPRIYLLDAQGKIVWFDIEYSRTSRRDLAQAIRYTLTHE
jgi:peroxiredoxin